MSNSKNVLTALKRVFYVAPKEFLLFIYFRVLKNRKHMKYLFEKLIYDVAYVVKYHDRDRTPPENEAKVLDQSANTFWWKKEFYEQNDFPRKCIEGYMQRLALYVAEKKPRSIVDIGCANGGRIDMLAAQFPQIEFIGIDFAVADARKGNAFKNARYIEAYPLDGLKELKRADMIFSTQALLHALPNELHAYFREFERIGVKFVSILDSNINGYQSKNDGKLWSKHMGYGTGWCHNYSGYLKQYGYNVTAFKDTPVDFHPSRADYHLVEIFGSKV